MLTPRPQDLVIELIRTLDEAREDGSLANGDGGGAIQMPVLYKHGSYSELERRLAEMREGVWRREWWHASQRYRYGDPHRRLVVRSRKTRQGRVPELPPRAELRIQGETIGGGLMVVYCYVWSERVEPQVASAGIDRLVALMYGGDTTRLTLPHPFLDRLLARTI